jgi:hypothetical protein
MLWFTRAALAFTLPLSAFVLFPRDARAQAPTRSGYTEQRTEAGAAVVFDDDLAKGTTFDPVGNIVRAPPRAARVTLLRPRYNFVSEMLKSVENL